jgi:hypothetical protein
MGDYVAGRRLTSVPAAIVARVASTQITFFHPRLRPPGITTRIRSFAFALTVASRKPALL